MDKRMPVNVSSRRLQTAVITAVMLFVVTYVLHFVITTITKDQSGRITDWRFISGTSAESIESDVSTYRQATKENQPVKQPGQPYVRLQYTLPATNYSQVITIRTDYSPIKVTINDKVVADNGYGKKNFTGSSYQSIAFSGNGNEQILDIYVYAPLAFNVDAMIGQTESSAAELFSRYLGLGLSIAVVFAGIMLGVISVLLATNSHNISCMLMLSLTVFAGGICGVFYSLSHSTMLLTNKIWFPVIILLQFILMIFALICVLSCCKSAAKKALPFLLAIFAFAPVAIFYTPWSLQVAAAVFAVLEVFVSIKALQVLSKTTASDVPHVGFISGLLIYAGLTELYNTCSMFLGIKLLSGYLYTYSIALLCIILFATFSKQIVFLEIKKQGRIDQSREDSEWIVGITGLITDAFMEQDEKKFAIEVSKNLSNIIEKNCISGENMEVYSSIAIDSGNEFLEIYNEGGIKNCQYKKIAEHLKKSERGIMVGNTTLDMLYTSEKHMVIIHFENILCGMYDSIGEIIKVAHDGLEIAFKNLNTKYDLDKMEERLMIQLAELAEIRCKSTNEHQLAMGALTYELCRELGVDDNSAHQISVASMLHDIGKAVIEEPIPENKEKYTGEELGLMKLHALYGSSILSLKDEGLYVMAAEIAKQHHENYDGSGLFGVSGVDIDPAARIVHIINVFEWIMTDKVGKGIWTLKEAMDYMNSQSGIAFDPEILGAFNRCSERLINLYNVVYSKE